MIFKEVINSSFFFIVIFSNYDFSIDFFGLIFILLAYLVGLISFLALDTRLY
jgi:hypothetical protein